MMEGKVCILQNVSLFLKQCQPFLWSLVNSFNLYCLMGNGSWCWCQFLFYVKLDCSVATSTPSIFWLSFHLNICDKWVLTVNFSSSNVVLFHPMICSYKSYTSELYSPRIFNIDIPMINSQNAWYIFFLIINMYMVHLFSNNDVTLTASISMENITTKYIAKSNLQLLPVCLEELSGIFISQNVSKTINSLFCHGH